MEYRERFPWRLICPTNVRGWLYAWNWVLVTFWEHQNVVRKHQQRLRGNFDSDHRYSVNSLHKGPIIIRSFDAVFGVSLIKLMTTVEWPVNATSLLCKSKYNFTNIFYIQSYHGWIITSIIRCGMEILIYSQTSTVHRWSLWMDKFHPTLYRVYDYLSMLIHLISYLLNILCLVP